MSDSRRLAQELYEIRALALSHATSPQVGSSSVDGDGLVFRDGEGNDLGRIGGGEDGMEVEYLYGPKPNQPSAPIVSADANLISVRWDGLWVGGEDETDPGIVGAGSLDRVEVHVSSDEFFVPDPINSFAGVIPVTPEGGVAVVGPLAEAGDWHVVLMARGKDGQYGAPSERVHVVTTVGLMENELFGLALRAGEAMDSADGKNSVYYGDEEPQPLPRLDENGDPVLDDDGNPLFNEFTEGDIWFGEGNMPHVWSDTDGWVSAADERVDAIQSVVDELEGDLDAVRESADGKSKTFYRPTMPPASESSEGDLWFDTSAEGGNMPHRFTDGAWVPVADQRVQAIQDAMDDFESDLNTVRDTANGKNRTYYQSTMPATPPARAGDLWFNTANGYRLHRNNGTTFIEVADGRIAEVEDAVENIDISGPLSEARTEWLADAAADAQTKAQNAAAAAEAAAKAYADAVATGAVDGELEGLQDYADQAAEAARQAAIAAAIAEARVIANEARDEALAAALDADAVISQSIAQFESDLDLVRESADGKSKITWSPNAPSGDGKAGDTWFRTSGSNIIGHWRHSGSAWVSMSLDATVIPNLDAGKITSGFIDSERIAAGSIQAGKLMVGNFTNLVPDPAAQFNITDTWRRWGNESIGTADAFWRYGTTVNGNRGVRAGADEYLGSARWLTSTPFQVRPGDRYFIQVTSYNEHLVGGSPRFGLRLGDESNGYLGETPVTIMSNSGWETYTAIVEIPANSDIKQASLRYTIPSTVTSGYAYFVDPVVRPAVGGVMIEDGAIVAEKISAGAVGATAIAAESIDASKIVAGGIQADSLIVPGTVGSTLIKDGAITTSKIEAGSITAQSGIIASLDAGVISSGTIDTARLAAGSITADKLMVGGAANLFPDQDLVYPGGYGSWSVVNGGLERDGSGLQSGSYWGHTEFEVVPGERLSGGFTRELEGAGEVTLYVQLSPASTGAAWGSPQRVAAATSAGEASGTATIPAYARKARLGLYVQSSVPAGQRVRVTGIRVRRMTGSTLIEDGAITTEKIATGAITAESGVIGSLDAGKITVGEMDGARIKAGTIQADKILVGGAGNLLTNPGFTGGGTGWSIASYNPIITDSGGPTGEPVLSMQGASAIFPYLGGLGQSAAASFAPDLAVVEPGKRYAASVWVRAGVDIPVGNAGMGFRLRELGSAALGWSNPSTVTNREVIPANTWAKIEGEFQVPTDTGTWNRLAFGLRANGALNGQRVEFSAPVLLPKVGATLIEDGAITAEKIRAGAVTTEKITAGGIDAGVITTGELRGELIRAQSIAASALAATAIDGKTITGATVRTAAAGARVEMNSSGLYVKNQFGTNTVSMQNGTISVEGGTITGGTVRTSASGARVQLDVTGLKAYNPDGDETFSISSNTGTVDMEGNLRQTNEYGRFDIGPTVFASGADGRGAPGIAFARHSKPSGVAHQAGIALRQSGDGTGSFLQVQSEGGTAGWSFLNLATPGASAHTGLHRWFTGDDRSSFNINGDGNTYISTVNQAGKGNVWLQTYVRGRDHSQTRFSMQNSGRIFASTYVGSNPEARTSMLDMASEGTWLIAGSGTSATSSRNLNLNAYGDAYMRAYGRGNNPDLNSYVGVRQDGGAVIASAGGSEWIGVGYTGTSPGGDGIYVRTRGDLTMYMGRWSAPNINTGSGTDLIVTSQNFIGKKSSSRRYKIAEEPIEYTLPGIEDALLGMEVKTWFDRRSAERLAEAETEKTNGVVPLDDLKDVDPLRRIPGVVAEDLDAAGLGMFVVYNEDGSPESVMYDRLGVALVPAVKALRDRVNELEDKIGELWNG